MTALAKWRRFTSGTPPPCSSIDSNSLKMCQSWPREVYGLLAAKRIHAALALQAGMLEQLLHAKPNAELRLGLLELRKGLADAEKQIAELTDLLIQLLGLPCGTCLELVEPAL